MASQVTELRARLRAIIEGEFSAELAAGWQLWDDRLNAAVGWNGTFFGLSPEDVSPDTRDMLVDNASVLVQFYGQYDKKIDPFQMVDPSVVEDVAERLKRAITDENQAGNSRLWFFDVMRTTFVNDPTGNKTRFHMVVRSKGQNSAIVETTG